MQKFIYAVLDRPAEGALVDDSGADGIDAAPLERVDYRDLVAVISDIDPARFVPNAAAEARLQADLLKYQQVNAALFRHSGQGGMLPLKFGFTAADKAAVEAVLERAYLQLRAHLNRLRGVAELVVHASWEISRVIPEIAHTHPELISEDPVQTGKNLFEAVEAKKRGLIDTVHGQLSPLALDFAAGSGKTENMIFNRSYLVATAQGVAFDAAMNVLGDRYDGILSFRYIGPLPAYSFVNIELNQGKFELLDQARKTLNLPETVTWEQIKTAYRRLLLANHPDHHPDDPQAAQRCKAVVSAYELVSAYCQSLPEFAARGHEGDFSFAQSEVEKVFIVDDKGALLARGSQA